MDYKITLEQFLGLIEDEEVRVELEIDFGDDEDYYHYRFWYSDYRVSDEIAKEYRKCEVTSFSLLTEESIAEIKICIKM